MPAPRALACPDSLKGVLPAAEAAAALAEGLRGGGVEADECPVADGGEGTAAVLAAVLGGDWRFADVVDPLGRPRRARFLLLDDGTAVVESAEAIGLDLLLAGERDPLRASSRGLGELLLAALGTGPAELLVCLGGTATVDGGRGLLEVVTELPVPTRAACDVRTPLGRAARLFGAQKGASPEAVVELEARLAAMAGLRPFAALPGSGAAGGLGAALASLGAELVPGAETVLERIHFRERLAGVVLAITGEGTLDATTAEGKAPERVYRACRDARVRCAVFGGRVARPLAGAEIHALSGRPERAREDLAELGERLARSLLGVA